MLEKLGYESYEAFAYDCLKASATTSYGINELNDTYYRNAEDLLYEIATAFLDEDECKRFFDKTMTDLENGDF